MKKRIGKLIIFLFVLFLGEIVLYNNVFAGEILSKFVFDWDSIFFVKPELESITMYNNQFMIQWEKIDDVDGYIVYRKTTNDWKEIEVIKGSSNNWYFDKEICAEKNYRYTVSAYKKIKQSKLEEINKDKEDNIQENKSKKYKFGKKDKKIKLVSRKDKVGISYILGPVITKLDNYSIRWELCKGAQGYEVSYRDNVDAEWNKICNVDKDDNVYHIGGMYKKERYYRVRAYYNTEDKRVYSVGENYISLKDKNYEDCSILFEGDDFISGEKGNKNRFNYTKRVEALTDAKITVNGYGDRKLNNLVKKVEKDKTYFKGYNIICIALGSNDYLDDVEIGNVTDINKNSFYGQLNYILQKIEKQNKDAEVVFITPFYRNKFKKKENVNCYTLNNDEDFDLNDYADAMRQLGKYKDVYVYDSEKEGVINVDNVQFMTRDLVHPTEFAHGKIGCSFTSFLVEYELLKNDSLFNNEGE